jgi:hypothetical protein
MQQEVWMEMEMMRARGMGVGRWLRALGMHAAWEVGG